jgi:2-polyprenyl-3-methyl-5-hydroxy-6-metoxy-1,4-benzoquinol methylase
MSEPSLYNSLRIYDPERRIQFVPDRAAYLLEQVRGQEILHVGCTDWPITATRLSEGTLLHMRLRTVTDTLLGIDIARDALELMQSHGCDDVTYMDAEHLNLADRFNCILAGDVVEHLNNPGLFLAGAARHLSAGGDLIIGVPSAFSFNMLRVWTGQREMVHHDHAFYFSPKTLAELCRRHGLLPTRLVFTVQPRTQSESMAFIRMRSAIIRACPRLAPSFIMHFRHASEVKTDTYVTWS